MLYKLKKIGWYFNDKNNGLSIYKGNPMMQQVIHSDNNKKIFKFIKAMKHPISKNGLRTKLNYLSDKEFNDIFSFFLNHKWIYPVQAVPSIYKRRLSNFIDCFPNYSYPNYLKQIKDFTILLMGLGTGGSYVLEVLIKMGFHHFILIDGDKVERKNIMAQNYSTNDVGKFKANVLYSKYSTDNVKITKIDTFIRSYAELKSKVNLHRVNYFINCADDFKLQINILNHIFNEFPSMKMIYGGYSFLMHSDDFLTRNNYKYFEDIALKQSKNINLNNYIITNSGSILNGFMNALTIGIYILRDVVSGKYNDQFLGDFYHNRFKFFDKDNL